MINGNYLNLQNNQLPSRLKENELKMKHYIRRLLEHIELTSLSAYFDLEDNQLKIRLSASYRDSPSPISTKGAFDDIALAETCSQMDQILTSGLTALERELMDEHLMIIQNMKNEKAVCEMHPKKNSPQHRGISGV